MIKLLSISLLIVQFVFAQALTKIDRGPEFHRLTYKEGDWVSYKNFSAITKIDVGAKYVFFATPNGILRYHRYNFFWDDPFTESDGITGLPVINLRADYASNRLIVTTADGDFSYDEVNRWWEKGARYSVTSYPPQDSLPVFSKKLSGFIAPTGFSFFSEPLIVQDPTFRRFPIITAFDDGWQNIWFGTNGYGAGFADLRSFRIHPLPWGLIRNSVNGMAYDGESYWFGGIGSDERERSGISRWNVETGRWIWYETGLVSGLTSSQVTVIRADGPYVWFGTKDQGVFRFDRKTDEWKNWTTHQNLESNQITDISISGDWVWVAGSYGVSRINQTNLAAEGIRDARLINQPVHSIRTQEDRVWIATQTGIYLFHPLNEVLDFIQPEGTGIIDLRTYSISVFENEAWFGTGSGIQIYDLKKKQWKEFPAANYFFDGTITYLLADKKFVWAGTNSGLLRYHRQKRTWTYYDTTDGLVDDRVQSLMLDGDYLWIGTPKGVTRFFWNDPDRTDN